VGGGGEGGGGVVEAGGGRVRLVDGDARLLKVTTPADLALVESLLAAERGPDPALEPEPRAAPELAEPVREHEPPSREPYEHPEAR
jgi:hypothetical protein